MFVVLVKAKPQAALSPQAALQIHISIAFGSLNLYQFCTYIRLLWNSRCSQYGSSVRCSSVMAVHMQEHKLYPNAVAALADGRITWREDGVPILWSPH